MKELDLADFSLVELRSENGCTPTPHCKLHGAMNKITKDGIWRCLAVSGYKTVVKGNSVSKQHVETICRAGCEFSQNTSNPK